jgi:hypothetical protein
VSPDLGSLLRLHWARRETHCLLRETLARPDPPEVRAQAIIRLEHQHQAVDHLRHKETRTIRIHARNACHRPTMLVLFSHPVAGGPQKNRHHLRLPQRYQDRKEVALTETRTNERASLGALRIMIARVRAQRTVTVGRSWASNITRAPCQT